MSNPWNGIWTMTYTGLASEAWTERLVDFGMSEDKAEENAEELITLLREISFEQRIRPTDYWVIGGVAGSQASFESVKSSVGPSRRNVSQMQATPGDFRSSGLTSSGE